MNQLMAQYREYIDHLFWGSIAISVAMLLILGIWAIAMYGLTKQVCVALARFLHAKASVEEDEYRKRQVWKTSKATPEVTPQGSDFKYRPKD